MQATFHTSHKQFAILRFDEALVNSYAAQKNPDEGQK